MLIVSLFSIKKERRIIRKLGEIWKRWLPLEKSGPSVYDRQLFIKSRRLKLRRVTAAKAPTDSENCPYSESDRNSSVCPFSASYSPNRWLTQPHLHQFCKLHGILLMGYSPFGGQHPVAFNKAGPGSPLEDQTVLTPWKLVNK